MLCRLLAGLDRHRFIPRVISMLDGPMRQNIEALGVSVRSLDMRRGVPNPLSILKLIRWLREDPPDVIQTWMYHADLIGGLAAKLAGGIPVAWGIHQSDLSREGNKWLTLQTIRACARLSRSLPARIVCSSEASRRAHANIGYVADKMTIIQNGSDLNMFKPDPEARLSVRRELEIPEHAPLIGLVGRFHPQKDHRNFIQAAAAVYQERPDVHFLLCGDEVTWGNLRLATWIEEAGIRRHCRLLGRRDDVPRLMAALDIAATSSSGESFPNVIVEAMSCGVPCAVTDVGDSALIVGQSGLVVPPRQPGALAEALRSLIDVGRDGRIRMGATARYLIKERFDLPQIVSRYQNLYQELMARPSRRQVDCPMNS